MYGKAKLRAASKKTYTPSEAASCSRAPAAYAEALRGSREGSKKQLLEETRRLEVSHLLSAQRLQGLGLRRGGGGTGVDRALRALLGVSGGATRPALRWVAAAGWRQDTHSRPWRPPRKGTASCAVSASIGLGLGAREHLKGDDEQRRADRRPPSHGGGELAADRWRHVLRRGRGRASQGERGSETVLPACGDGVAALCVGWASSGASLGRARSERRGLCAPLSGGDRLPVAAEVAAAGAVDEAERGGGSDVHQRSDALEQRACARGGGGRVAAEPSRARVAPLLRASQPERLVERRADRRLHRARLQDLARRLHSGELLALLPPRNLHLRLAAQDTGRLLAAGEVSVKEAPREARPLAPAARLACHRFLRPEPAPAARTSRPSRASSSVAVERRACARLGGTSAAPRRRAAAKGRSASPSSPSRISRAAGEPTQAWSAQACLSGPAVAREGCGKGEVSRAASRASQPHLGGVSAASRAAPHAALRTGRAASPPARSSRGLRGSTGRRPPRGPPRCRRRLRRASRRGGSSTSGRRPPRRRWCTAAAARPASSTRSRLSARSAKVQRWVAARGACGVLQGRSPIGRPWLRSSGSAATLDTGNARVSASQPPSLGPSRVRLRFASRSCLVPLTR